MKKATKIALITAGIIFGVGVILCLVVGFMTDFRFDNVVITNEKLEKKTIEIEDTFKDIEIITISDDIEIQPSEDKKCTVSYTDSENTKHRAEVINGKLSITEEHIANSWFQFHFFSFSGEKKTIVYLPEESYGMIHLSTTSGDISCREKMTSDTLQLNTVSGDIILTNMQTKNDINIHTTSGNATTESINCSWIEVNAISGDILLDKLTAPKSVSLNTTSGDINLHTIDTEQITAETVSGDISGNLTGYTIRTETVSGSVTVSDKESGANICTLKTVSGDIRIS